MKKAKLSKMYPTLEIQISKQDRAKKLGQETIKLSNILFLSLKSAKQK